MDISAIRKRVQNNQVVTPAEYAQLLASDKEAFFAFLIANNPGSMNDILKNRLGYSFELGFYPDKKAITRICQQILDRDNKAEIKTILDNFKVNLSALSPELIEALKTTFNTYQTA